MSNHAPARQRTHLGLKSIVGCNERHARKTVQHIGWQRDGQHPIFEAVTKENIGKTGADRAKTKFFNAQTACS